MRFINVTDTKIERKPTVVGRFLFPSSLGVQNMIYDGDKSMMVVPLEAENLHGWTGITSKEDIRTNNGDDYFSIIYIALEGSRGRGGGETTIKLHDGERTRIGKYLVIPLNIGRDETVFEFERNRDLEKDTFYGVPV